MKRALMVLVALGTIGWFTSAASTAQADHCYHGHPYRPSYSAYYPRPYHGRYYRPPVPARAYRPYYRPHRPGYVYYPGSRGYVSFGFGF